MIKLRIRKVIAISFVGIAVLFFSALGFGGRAYACDFKRGYDLFGIPPWYKYLSGEEVEQRDGSKVCQPKFEDTSGELPKKGFALIAAAILEILLRIAALAAFFYLIYGGFMYLTSSGNAESVKKAGSTLLNAAIGLAIAISATTLVNFFASRLTQ